ALSLRLELLWWLVTAIIVFVVIYPILSKIENYPFLVINTMFVIIFITLTRYMFLLKHTFIAHNEKIKVALIVLCLPIIFYLISELYNFQIFLDEEGITNLIGKTNITAYDEQLLKFIRSEMLLFGVGSIIATFLFPFRMVLSIWRVRNRGTI
ncbi:MAG: hypothetical protein AB8G15_07190, partial [Saprospiraceae bacterium]